MRNSSPVLVKKAYFFASNVTVSANATGQINFQIDSQYDYMATGFSYKSTDIFNLQFFDNEQKIFYDYIACEVFNGIYTGMPAWGDRHWNDFPAPPPYNTGYVFRAKSNINVHLQDTSGAENIIKIYIKGYRMYMQ